MPLGLNLGLGISAVGSSAVASGDFTNIATSNAADGVYTRGGETAEIGDIFDLNHLETVFNSVTDIDAGGIKPRADGEGGSLAIAIELQADLVAELAAGFTMLVEVFAEDETDDPDGIPTTVGIYPHDADWILSPFAEIRCGVHTKLIPLNSGDGVTDTVNLVPSGQISKVAFTLTDTAMAFSINGGTAQTAPSGALNGSITNIQLSVGGGVNARVRVFAFNEPVDNADLPGLSAL